MTEVSNIYEYTMTGLDSGYWTVHCPNCGSGVIVIVPTAGRLVFCKVCYVLFIEGGLT